MRNVELQSRPRGAESIAFLRLAGVLDDKNVISFKKSVFNIPARKKSLVLDLSRLEQVKNAGLPSLLEVLRYFRQKGGRIFLVNPGEELELLLRHFRADGLAEIVRSYEEVLDLLPTEMDESAFFPDADQDFDAIAEGHRHSAGNAPVVHYHYYGQQINPGETVSERKPEPGAAGIEGSLHELNQRLKSLQRFIENAETFQSRDSEKKCGGYAKDHDEVVDRLQSMERAIEGHLDRMEARILDQIEHSYSRATPLSVRPAAAPFPGFRMVECAGCGAVLRIRQTGRHMCPQCQKEFTVNERGDPEF